jgi:hypothetical protein
MSVRRAWLAIALVVPAASLGVIGSMLVPSLRGTMLGQSIYVLGKVWLILFPIVWWCLVLKRPIRISTPTGRDLRLGAIAGIAIGAAITAGWWFFGRSMIDIEQLRQEVITNGLTTLGRFVAFAAFLSIANALMEEYLWRWFVQSQAKVVAGPVGAIVLSAALFTVHHVIALRAQLDWTPALLASAGVFIGGVIWSMLRERTGRIWAGAVSHLIVDVTIFIIAGWMLFG